MPLSQITAFAGAIVDEWSSLATGGFVMAVVYTAEKVRESRGAKPIASIWYVRLMMLFVAVACYRAWSKEHDQVLALNGKVESLQTGKQLAASLIWKVDHDARKLILSSPFGGSEVAPFNAVVMLESNGTLVRREFTVTSVAMSDGVSQVTVAEPLRQDERYLEIRSQNFNKGQ